MKDKFTYALVSGILASSAQAVFIFIVFSFNLTNLKYQDFIGTFIYGHQPEGMFEALFAEFALWLFGGFLGVVFTYLLPIIGKEHYILKSCFFGIVIWFFLYALTILFKVPGFTLVKPLTSFMSFLGASVYGIALGLISQRLGLKTL